MIAPAYGRNIKEHPTQRLYALYYLIAFFLCLANLVPILFAKAHFSDLSSETVDLLHICYLVSIPLLFEFILDSIAAKFQALSPLKDLEHRFGHGLLLLSLFLVVFVVPFEIENDSVIVVNSVFSLLQTLVIVGVFGKLLAHGNGHWSIVGCWSVVVLFVLSKIFSEFGIFLGKVSSEFVFVALSLVCMILCFLVHIYLGKKLFVQYLACRMGYTAINCESSSGIDDIVCCILQGIVSLYLLVSIFALAVFLSWRYPVDTYTNVEILKQLILALCAAILPGRMIRRSFILLKVSNSLHLLAC